MPPVPEHALGASRMSEGWRDAWAQRPFRVGLLWSVVVGLPAAIALPFFFAHIELVPGILLNDPVLRAIGPVNVSWITFTVLYTTVVLSVGWIARRPWLVLRGLHAYVALLVMRMLTMTAFTLEPPADIIPLIDPVTSIFYPGGVPFLKDLFFSGHTATLALMFCLVHGIPARVLTAIATAAVGALVLLQHVHWTVDVLAAPFFVWLAWRVSRFTLRACGAPVA